MIPESEMSLNDMKRAEAEGYLCRECQSMVNIAWGGYLGINSYILRCSKDINHTGITRHDIKYEEQKKEVFSMESKALMTMNETQMMERVNMARFPQDLTIADKKLLAQVAITYGFDPLMGEVSIYQGRPYVSIDGRYRKAQETGNLDGVESRPATKQERTDWQIPDGDYFFRGEVFVKGASRPFVAWGRVFQAETLGGKGFKPVEKNPQRMAEKRAEAQALRKAFHIPLPSVEDIGSPDYDAESTAVELDTTTGEIKEPKPKKAKGEYAESPAHTEKAEPKKAQQAPQEAAGQATQPPDEESKAETPEKQEEAPLIDLAWLKESLKQLGWTDCGKYLINKYKVTGKKISEMVLQLTPDQQHEFAKEVQDRLSMS